MITMDTGGAVAGYHGHLIGTLVEWPADLPAPRPPLMKRMCAGYRDGAGVAHECGLVLGWVVCIAALAGEVSVGMCEGCAMLHREAVVDARANAGAGKI